MGATKMKMGITFGVFDLFHAGHCLMLREARRNCDYLIACVQTDPTCREGKNVPIQSISERVIQLHACRYVDDVKVYNTEDDVIRLLAHSHWDVRIIGEEYQNRNFTGRDLCEGKIYYNSRTHNYSTTELRRRIQDAPI